MREPKVDISLIGNRKSSVGQVSDDAIGAGSNISWLLTPQHKP